MAGTMQATAPEAGGKPEHDEFWSVWDRPEVIDAILYAPEVCHEEDWTSPDDWHEDPDSHNLDDLIDMFVYDENMCPLHVRASYPYACNGEVQRQYVLAFDRLVQHTQRHTGCAPWHQGGDPYHHRYHATSEELRELWNDYPHARHQFEEQARAGTLTIEVVD